LITTELTVTIRLRLVACPSIAAASIINTTGRTYKREPAIARASGIFLPITPFASPTAESPYDLNIATVANIVVATCLGLRNLLKMQSNGHALNEPNLLLASP
jgi:hypothetical protein